MAIGQTLVQIRERSAVDLLDLALVVVRRKPGTLALAALAGIIPFAGINAWLFASFPDLNVFFAMTLWMLEAPFATAPLTVVLGGLMFDRKPSVVKVLGSLAHATFSLIVIHGVVRFVAFFWLTSKLAFANEVLLLERGKWWKLFGRGGDLASGREGELFLLGCFQVILTFAFATIFYAGTSNLAEMMVAEELTWDLPEASMFAGWRYQLPIWLVTAFFAVARFLTYIDQRIRLEGWEVELRLRAVGQAIEEARRW